MEAMATAFSIGFLGPIMLLSGGGMLGMPPGERDAAFLNAAPAKALIYYEWAERAPGKPGAAGIDGFAADPEVKAFLGSIERAIRTAIDNAVKDGDPEKQIVAKAIPPLLLSFLQRPGCLFASFDETVITKAAAAGEPLDPQTALKGLQLALVINGGDEVETMVEHINDLLGLLPPDSKTEGMKLQPLPLPLPGVQAFLHRHKKYIMIGLGKSSIETVTAGLDGDSKGLASNERFTAAMKTTAIERTSGVSWIDVKGIVETASKAMGLQGAIVTSMATMIGADAIDSIATTTGVVDGQIRSKSFITTGGRTDGILALAAGRGIEAADFAGVPADADFLFSFSLNAPKILSTVREIVGKADADSLKNMNMMIEQLEKELNVSIEDDIFKAFGDVWTIYDSPSAGGFYFTSAVAGLEVQDPRKAYDVVSKLMQVLKDSLPGERAGGFRRRAVYLSQQKFMDRTIYYVNVVGDDDVPFAPSFCVTDKQFLVAPHPQAMKAHLRFLASGEKNFGSLLVGDRKLPEGDLFCMMHFDCKKLTEILYAFAPYLAQVAYTHIQSEGGEIDIFSLPSARAVLPYVNDSTGTVVRTKEGILSEGRSGLPIPGGFSAGLLLPFSAIIGIRAPMRFRLGDRPNAPRVVAPAVRVRIRRAQPAAVPEKGKPVKAKVEAKAKVKIKADSSNSQEKQKKKAKTKSSGSAA